MDGLTHACRQFWFLSLFAALATPAYAQSSNTDGCSDVQQWLTNPQPPEATGGRILQTTPDLPIQPSPSPLAQAPIAQPPLTQAPQPVPQSFQPPQQTFQPPQQTFQPPQQTFQPEQPSFFDGGGPGGELADRSTIPGYIKSAQPRNLSLIHI